MKLKNPVNIILLAISFVIFGSLGLIFITQMELLPGYNWDDKQNLYPTEMELQLTGDLNGDGVPDLISNAFTRDIDERDLDRITHKIPQYGGIFAIDSKTGTIIWEKEYTTPVRELMLIGDINNDGYDDYLANMMRVNETWITEYDNYSREWRYKPQIIHNQFTNRIISGWDLIEGGGNPLSGNITTNLVYDAIKVSNLGDNVEDLILLEGKFFPLPDYHYKMNISTYYINGTKTKTIEMNAYVNPDLRGGDTPALREFNYDGESHALFISENSLILFNTSVDNLLDPIFNITIQSVNTFNIIEDITLDGIPEILTATFEGNVSLINGFDGSLITQFTVPIEPDGRVNIRPMGSEMNDGTAYVLLTIDIQNNPQQVHGWVYTITETEQDIIWEYHKFLEENEDMPNLNVLADITGDITDEIILAYRHTTLMGTEVTRVIIYNPVTNIALTLVNADYHMEEAVIIPDFDGDGLNDIAFEDGSRIIGIASQDPIAIFLSPLFGIGLFLFILLVTVLILGIIILIINGRKLKPKRQRLQQSKMAVVVNIVVIALMIVSFLMFLLQLNIFNRTLILGDPMTGITEVYLAVTIIWFGFLPLTAAIYNQFSPRFAYGFVALRSLFFKLSKSYKSAIFIEDLQGRKQLSTTIRLKRVILPMLLSISVGFYTYNSFSSVLGYPQTFDTFGAQDFFQFMIGYNLLCLLPMLLTFIAFSFFISGNFLLDDAGVAYYLESKKHRKPGDIEPISIWASSIIKGIAGFSAIVTFFAFFQTVDFSGFFTETGENALFMFIFGIFIVTVMFYGTPFLTSFAYILFSIEVMDYSYDSNSERLYEIMRKNGYDTTPRSLANLFPSGYEPLRTSKDSRKKKK
ncbi:MAG: hypothetical protein KGD73_09440 [Candidatus Lokiarchaeota archaeon]|nr:hypothetical protein [Candidatus Lokiarchaeota archaeon]